MHNKFLFWASIFLRFANQWFSCSFCWSQQPFVKVHCMGCSIGLECGRVSFFRQSHVRQANSEIMQMRGKKGGEIGVEGESKNDFLFRSGFTLVPCSFATRSAMCSWEIGVEGESKNDFLFRSGFTLVPCSFATRSAMCSWSTIHYLVLSHAHDQLWLKRKIRSGLPSLLEKPYMVKPALSRHLLPCGMSACVCFPKVVCVDKCVSNQKWGQRHLEITDWKKK